MSNESERLVSREDEPTLRHESVVSEDAYDTFIEDTSQLFAVWSLPFEETVEIGQDNLEVWETAEGRLIQIKSER